MTVPLERPRVFFATVFNTEQIDGLPPIKKPERHWDPIARAERILAASDAMIQHNGFGRAFYRPSTDSIHLPDQGQFPSADNYYATALHELGHWTGHPSRLDRDLAHPFGSEGYAKEELRAEIASMILGDELGIGHDPGQHAVYVGSWIRVLNDDPLEIFRAAADAEKIQHFVLTLAQQIEQTPTQETTMPVTQPEQSTNHNEVARDPEGEIVAPNAIQPAQATHAHNQIDDATSDEASNQTTNLTYINVPFREKNAAKQLGARWDRQRKSWFVPPGVALAPFASWMQPPNAEGLKNVDDRIYLAVPYGKRKAAKAAGALWDKAVKSWYTGPDADLVKLDRWIPAKLSAYQDPAMTPAEEFGEAMKSLGCIVTGDHPVMDGTKHRIAVEGDKKGEKAGFYVGHLDGHPAGYIKNNRTGIEMKWKSKGYALNPEEKTRLQAEAAGKLAERAAGQNRLHELTAQRVSRQREKLVPITEPTPYLHAKGIHAHVGAMTDEHGQITYIPAIDPEGKHWTMQYIQADGTKRFAKNSRKEGCFHPVGGMDALAAAPVLVIAEGYATATTLSEALRQATVAAFDSGNLPHVARALHEKFPEKPIIIAGDDDRHLEASQGMNPGRVKAEEAAKAVGGMAVFPIFAPGEIENNPKAFTDFNDLAGKSELGKDGVKRQIKSAVRKAMLNEHWQDEKSQKLSAIKKSERYLQRIIRTG